MRKSKKYWAFGVQTGKTQERSLPVWAFHQIADVMLKNMTSFRVFGPDETASNKLDAIYQASEKTWMAEMKLDDADGGFLSTDGRVMEMLSEHTLEGWTSRHCTRGVISPPRQL
jgi:phosphoketolase